MKSPITRLVWQIDQRCLGLSGGFWGWPIQWNHAKCCRADPCCHNNEIWSKIAFNSARMARRPHMFAPTRGFSGMADSVEPCKMLRADPARRGDPVAYRLVLCSSSFVCLTLCHLLVYIYISLLAVSTRPPDRVVSALRASVNDLGLD